MGFINNYSGIQEHSLKHLIQDEDIQRIMDFVTPLLEKGEEIVVHCGEGSVRSPAIAHFIHHMAEYVAMAPAYNPSGTYRDHSGSDRHMCRHTHHACVNYYNKKLTEGKTLIDMYEATKLCDEAGIEWRQAYSYLEWYKIDGKRMFAKEEVEAALAKIQALSQPQSEEVKAVVVDRSEFAGESPEGNQFLKDVAHQRIHHRATFGPIISESTIDSSDPYSPEMVRALAQEQANINSAMPRLINTGVKDCSAGGCERCKKDKQ